MCINVLVFFQCSDINKDRKLNKGEWGGGGGGVEGEGGVLGVEEDIWISF